MKNKIIVVIVFFCICIISGLFILLNWNGNEEQNKSSNQIVNNIINTNKDSYTNTANKESENKLISNIKVIVDGKTYNAKIEENQTTINFINMLPQKFNMNELNGNEKYVYLDTTLPTNSYNPKHIETGDIMLYGNNCLVVFYKSFDTPYSYTKIGHIENFKDLDSNNIMIEFKK